MGVAALASLFERDAQAVTSTADSPACRISRRKPSASSICSNPAALRRWSCSTTSLGSKNSRAPIFRIPFAEASGSPACRPRNRAFRWCRRSFSFAQRGNSGAWVSELLPYTREIADKLTFIKTVTPKRSTTIRRSRWRKPVSVWAAARAWAPGSRYGLGCETEDLPAFCRHDLELRRRPAALRPPLGQRLSCPAAIKA